MIWYSILVCPTAPSLPVSVLLWAMWTQAQSHSRFACWLPSLLWERPQLSVFDYCFLCVQGETHASLSLSRFSQLSKRLILDFLQKMTTYYFGCYLFYFWLVPGSMILKMIVHNFSEYPPTEYCFSLRFPLNTHWIEISRPINCCIIEAQASILGPQLWI